MDGGNWRREAWPSPDARARQRLPRVEDLPPAEHGLDREKVREAFDSFYRHIAQLDSTVRALEAVEVFRDQAGELRKELRALRAAGWTQQPWPAPAAGRASPGLPEALPRFAIEAAFLIVVAVVVAVAGFDRLSIVLVMALAWTLVGIVEWAASRERFARARVPAPARAAPEPAPLRVVPAAVTSTPALPADSWKRPPELEERDEDERTVIQTADVAAPREEAEPEQPAAEAEPTPEPAEEPEPVLALPPAAASFVEVEYGVPEPPDDEPVVEEPVVEEPGVEEPEPEPAIDEADAASAPGRWSWAADTAFERAQARELAERGPEPKRRFWQRRRRDTDGLQVDAAQPRHVRVLPPAPSFDEQFPIDGSVDPWERDLDLSIEEPEGSIDGEPERDREAALDRGEHS